MSEDYFNTSRLKVIGMITAATVAVGALGGIAGVAFDPDPVTQDNVVQPGGGGARLAPQELGSPGTSVAKGPAVASADRFASLDGGFTASPQPTTGPTPTTPDTGGTDGSSFALSATGAELFVPAGWSVDNSSENQVYLSSGQGSFAFGFSYVDDPSAAAGDLITNNLESLLPGESYTQLQTSDVVTLDPFGSLVSVAAIEYGALWVDNQGSADVHGQIYLGVRQDGTVLGILLEHIPGADFETAFEELVPILDSSFGRFAGLG